MSFYSQHGEDVLANEIFKDKNEGFFVEIGCIDGRRFSNTLYFEEKGWQGLCIEAHYDYISLLKKNRPHSIVCDYAVGETNKDNAIFYTNTRGSLSTLNKKQEKHFQDKYDKYFSGFKEQTVKIRTLNYILDKYKVEAIDILSLDIEGYEIEALQGLNINKYQPRLLIIESDNASHEKQLDSKLSKTDYHKSIRIHNNIFYLRDKEDHLKVADKKIRATLIHTEHPLDKHGDKKVKVLIDTTKGISKSMKDLMNNKTSSIQKFYKNLIKS